MGSWSETTGPGSHSAGYFYNTNLSSIGGGGGRSMPISRAKHHHCPIHPIRVEAFAISAGKTRVTVLEITGGADLAERFEVSESSTSRNGGRH